MEIIKVKDIVPNETNPRFIKDDKFSKLVKSIQDFPEMLKIRPLVLNKDMMVLGGNMRLNAVKEAGIEEVPVIIASGLTPEQEKEFVIKDNLNYGIWDWNQLTNDPWELSLLMSWGIDLPGWQMDPNIDNLDLDDLESLQAESQVESENPIERIKIKLTNEEFEKISNGLKELDEDYGSAVLKILV